MVSLVHDSRCAPEKADVSRTVGSTRCTCHGKVSRDCIYKLTRISTIQSTQCTEETFNNVSCRWQLFYLQQWTFCRADARQTPYHWATPSCSPWPKCHPCKGRYWSDISIAYWMLIASICSVRLRNADRDTSSSSVAWAPLSTKTTSMCCSMSLTKLKNGSSYWGRTLALISTR